MEGSAKPSAASARTTAAGEAGVDARKWLPMMSRENGSAARRSRRWWTVSVVIMRELGGGDWQCAEVCMSHVIFALHYAPACNEVCLARRRCVGAHSTRQVMFRAYSSTTLCGGCKPSSESFFREFQYYEESHSSI